MSWLIFIGCVLAYACIGAFAAGVSRRLDNLPDITFHNLVGWVWPIMIPLICLVSGIIYLEEHPENPIRRGLSFLWRMVSSPFSIFRRFNRMGAGLVDWIQRPKHLPKPTVDSENVAPWHLLSRDTPVRLSSELSEKDIQVKQQLQQEADISRQVQQEMDELFTDPYAQLSVKE